MPTPSPSPKSGVPPVAQPLPAKPPPTAAASALPFPESSASAGAAGATRPMSPQGSPLTPSRPVTKSTLSARDRALLEEEPPPLWLQILAIPVATRGRAIATGLVGFVVVGILSLNHVIESNKPKESAVGPVIDMSPARPLADPAGGAPIAERRSASGELSPEVRGQRRQEAEAALDVIEAALRAYDADRRGAPRYVSPDARELQPYADMTRTLPAFADRRFSYQLEEHPNPMLESITISAYAKESRELVTRTIVLTRRR